MKRRIFSLLAASALVLGLAGCAQKADAGFDKKTDITVVSREDGSGTRGAFVELFGVEQEDENGEKVDRTTVDANITNSTEVMLSTVSGNEYAIGYVSLGSLNDKVKALTIGGVEASVENILSGEYTVSRPFNIVTNDSLSEVGQDFITYILSADGQKIVSDEGYVPISDAAAYTASGLEGDLMIAGSSSVYPVMMKLAEAYMEINSGVKIEVQQSDSTTGIQNAIDGTCDIGMASRELKDSESAVTGTTIAMDGIAVIVNLDNPVSDMSIEQVCGIYTGETTTWETLVTE